MGCSPDAFCICVREGPAGRLPRAYVDYAGGARDFGGLGTEAVGGDWSYDCVHNYLDCTPQLDVRIRTFERHGRTYALLSMLQGLQLMDVSDPHRVLSARLALHFAYI